MIFAILDKIPNETLVLLQQLENHSFYDFSFMPLEYVYDKLKYADGIIFRSRIPLDSQFFNSYPNISTVIRLGAGLDHIDLKVAKAKNVKIFSTKGDNAEAVGDHTIGMLLTLTKNIWKSANEVRKFLWKRSENKGTEISSLTIGIIGFGNTGSAFAKRLSGFNTTILAYDKYKKNYAPDYVKETSLKEICRRADVISFHVPLTYETYHYFNSAMLQNLQKNIYLLNLSRGPVVNTRTLINGLNFGKIIGAALDVLEEENLNNLSPRMRQYFSELIKRENVIITPHIGGWSKQTDMRRREKLLEILGKL